MRLFALIGGFFVLLLVAALAVPPLVDWSSFRTDFERQASRVLGQGVTVSGATSARLLPWPKIDFEAVAIGRGEDGSPLLTLDRLAFDVEIAPLLKGDVRVVEMQLDRPQGRVRLAADGSVNWFESGTNVRVLARETSIERLIVRDGSLTLSDVSRGTEIEIEALDAELTADSLAGPWRGKGAFTLGGERYGVAGTTGALKTEEGVRRISTRISLEPESLAYTMTMTGPVSIESGDAAFEGAFTVEPRRDSDAAPVFVDGAMRLDRRKLDMPGFVVRVGEGDDPYRMEGRAEAFFAGEQRYRLRLQGAQVDVDRVARADTEIVGVERRLAALGDLLRRVPLPALPGEVRLELPALVAGDTVIRELSADIRPLADRTGWEVARFEATLPGRTLVEASGRLAVPRSQGDGIGFAGRMLLASRQPSGFASWLVGDVDDAIRQLGSAGFEAQVTLGGRSARFDDLELRLGADILRGTLGRIAGTQSTPPRILANLQGTRIDARTAQAVFDLVSGERSDGASVLAHDLDLRLRANEIAADGIAAQDVDLVTLYEKGNLAIDRLTVGRLDGVSFDLKGRIDALYTRPKGQMSGALALDDPAAALALFERRGWSSPVVDHLVREPSLLAGTRLDVAMTADRAGLESTIGFEVSGTIGSTRSRIVGRYEGELDAADPKVSLTVETSNEEPVALLRQLGLKASGTNVEGPASLDLSVDGEPGSLAVEVALATPGGRISTKGGTRYVAGQGDLYDGTFEMVGRDLAPLLRAGGIDLPGAALPVSLTGSIIADADRVALDAVKGRVRGVETEASLVLDTDIDPRPRLDGSLSVASIDLKTLIGSVLGREFAPLADRPGRAFGTPLLEGLDGDIRLTAGSAELSLGSALNGTATDLEAEITLNDGDIEMDALEADWLGGKLSGTANAAKAGRNGVVGADLTLVDGDIAKTGLVDRLSPRVRGRFDLALAVEAQAEEDVGLVDALSGGASLTVRDGVLRGFRPSSFDRLLAAADATDDAVLERSAAGLAEAVLFDGETRIADAIIPFTIANGTARATGIPIVLDGVETTVDLRLDAANATARGTLRGTLEPPDDAADVAGVTPDFRVDFSASSDRQTASLDATTLTTYLTTRLRERREREFEAQRAAILERQRLVRAMRLSRERERRALERLRARGRTEAIPG